MSRKPTHVLVPTDFSDTAAAALEYALELCELLGARLTVLHVTNRKKVEEGLMGLDSLQYLFRASTAASDPSRGGAPAAGSLDWDRLHEIVRRKLEESVSAELRSKLSVEFVCQDGYPSQSITGYARDHGVDLIVMGTHGRGRTALFVLGSVTQNVIRQAECPVLTIKAVAGAEDGVCQGG